jgi:hypothetical protein
LPPISVRRASPFYSAPTLEVHKKKREIMNFMNFAGFAFASGEVGTGFGRRLSTSLDASG